jgi:ABC-2 type transport system permease protein
VIRLLVVELTRLRWRRAVLVLLGACVVVPTVILAVTAWNTRPVSEADLQHAQEQVDQMRRSDHSFDRTIERCQHRPERFGVSSPEDCEAQLGPQVEWFVSRSPLDVPDLSRGLGPTLCVLLAGLLMLVGTTFAGADWNSGSMSNQLLFEPRRLRVWAAKAGAAFVVAGVVSALVLAAFWAAIMLLASSRGIDVAPQVTSYIRGESLRGVALAAVGGLGAFAVTMFFRSTVATLGILFGIALVGSLILAALGVSDRWFPHINVGAWILDGVHYYVDPPASCQAAQHLTAECRSRRTVTQGDAAAYLGAFLAMAVVLSAASFRRRDVP